MSEFVGMDLAYYATEFVDGFWVIRALRADNEDVRGDERAASLPAGRLTRTAPAQTVP